MMSLPRLNPEPCDLGTVQVAWLACAAFVVSSGYGALLPLLPSWLGSLMPGATAASIGLHVGFLSGAYAAGLLVGAPIWGWLSDRWGRTRVLLLGLLGYVLSLPLMLLPGFDDMRALYALRAAGGLAVAAVIPVVSALVAERTPEHKRARRFAWLGAMTLFGFLVGPALNELVLSVWQALGTGEISSRLTATTVIALSAVLGSIAMVGVATKVAMHVPAAAHIPHVVAAVSTPSATALWWLGATVMFVIAGFEVATVLRGQDAGYVSPRGVALMLALCSAAMLAVNGVLFLTSLLEKAPARTLIALGLAIAMAGLATLAAASVTAWMYVAVGMTAAGTGLLLPVISYLAAGVEREKLGVTMGVLAAAQALGQTLGSLGTGWLYGFAGQSTFAWLLLPLTAIFIALPLRRQVVARQTQTQITKW